MDCEAIGINPMIESFNVPFNSYSSGSFFGDEDTLSKIIQNDDEGENKRCRHSTASALRDTDILVIRKSLLMGVLDKFPNVKSNCIRIANEKVAYHAGLVEQVITLYTENESKEELIKIRMEENQREITTYMSLKR